MIWNVGSGRFKFVREARRAGSGVIRSDGQHTERRGNDRTGQVAQRHSDAIDGDRKQVLQTIRIADGELALCEFAGAAGIGADRQACFVYLTFAGGEIKFDHWWIVIWNKRNQGRRCSIADRLAIHGVGHRIGERIRADQSGWWCIGECAVRVNNHGTAFCRGNLESLRADLAAIGFNHH